MKKLIAMAISYPNVINKESEKILKLFEAEEGENMAEMLILPVRE